MENQNTGKLYNRDKRIFFIYRGYSLTKETDFLDEEIYSTEAFEAEVYEFSKEQIGFIEKTIKSKDALELKISKFLPKDWKWKRFNSLEQAIILNGAAEILIAENTHSVVIDESINFAKKYCGEKSQALINGILDKIGK